jgi:hypothetical protein
MQSPKQTWRQKHFPDAVYYLEQQRQQAQSQGLRQQGQRVCLSLDYQKCSLRPLFLAGAKISAFGQMGMKDNSFDK